LALLHRPDVLRVPACGPSGCAPRIHGELPKPGLVISQAAVATTWFAVDGRRRRRGARSILSTPDPPDRTGQSALVRRPLEHQSVAAVPLA
jgi:hypothetical protein